MPGEQVTDRGAGVNPGAGGDPGPDRLVGGAQPVVVADGEYRPAGDRAGEQDGPGAGRADLRAGRVCQVHAPVPGHPRLRRRVEPACHAGWTGQRPPEPSGGRRPPGRAPVSRRDVRPVKDRRRAARRHRPVKARRGDARQPEGEHEHKQQAPAGPTDGDTHTAYPDLPRAPPRAPRGRPVDDAPTVDERRNRGGSATAGTPMLAG